MKNGRLHERVIEKQSLLFEDGMELFPFQHLQNLFEKEILKPHADHDLVHGIKREYIAASKLYSIYLEVYQSEALAINTIAYRMSLIQAEEFPDDFFVLSDTVLHEPKNFVNRLNTKLMKRIFLPKTYTDFHAIVKKTLELEQELKERMEEEECDEYEGLFRSKIILSDGVCEVNGSFSEPTVPNCGKTMHLHHRGNELPLEVIKYVRMLARKNGLQIFVQM